MPRKTLLRITTTFAGLVLMSWMFGFSGAAVAAGMAALWYGARNLGKSTPHETRQNDESVLPAPSSTFDG
jgi:hypothetical protein